MLSGKLHWLTMGLALLVSAGRVHSQTGVPSKPAGQAGERKTPARTASYTNGAAPAYEMLNPSTMGMRPGGDMPMHMAMQGPPPMDVMMEQGAYSDSGMACDSMGGGMMGGGMYGGAGSGCSACGGSGCLYCGAGNGCIGSGRFLGLLGALAPYAEGNGANQRWFDLSVGTIALARTSDVGTFQTSDQDPVTGVFGSTTLLSTIGQAGTPTLFSTDVDANKIRYGPRSDRQPPNWSRRKTSKCDTSVLTSGTTRAAFAVWQHLTCSQCSVCMVLIQLVVSMIPTDRSSTLQTCHPNCTAVKSTTADAS